MITEQHNNLYKLMQKKVLILLGLAAVTFAAKGTIKQQLAKKGNMLA